MTSTCFLNLPCVPLGCIACHSTIGKMGSSVCSAHCFLGPLLMLPLFRPSSYSMDVCALGISSKAWTEREVFDATEWRRPARPNCEKWPRAGEKSWQGQLGRNREVPGPGKTEPFNCLRKCHTKIHYLKHLITTAWKTCKYPKGK